MVILPLTQPAGSLNYDRKDFNLIGLTGILPNLLIVSPKVPANSTAELIAYAKARPGQMSFASSGAGTITHLIGELFNARTGIQAVHVPYKTGVQAAPDIMEGRVQYMFDSASSAIITAGTGKVKVLAVAAQARIPALPDVPTFAEQGFDGLDLPSWLGFYGPANMPAAVVEKLNTALAKVLAMPQVQEFYRNGGYEAGSTTPQEFTKITRTTYDQWGAMVQQVGLAKQ